MSAPQKAQSPGATGQSAERNADPQIVAGDVEQRKSLANIIARFALRGHSVHQLSEGGFLVCRHGLSKHCPDMPSLVHFARVTGVM